MEIDPTRTTASALGGQTVDNASTDLDRDAFMRLLVTQIRNQDPMDPMDTREMMSQLTELTSVEHLIGIEDRIGTLQIASASIANAQVADFVGKTVTADTTNLRVEDTGAVPGAFELDAAAERVTVTIRDAEGRPVRSLELGPHFAGGHGYEWDGMDEAGNRVAPGRYRMEIEAVSEGGHPVAAHARIRGRVTGVSYDDGYPELVLEGGHHVAMGDVRRIDGDAIASTSGGTRPGSAGTPAAALAVASYEATRRADAPSSTETETGDSDR